MYIKQIIIQGFKSYKNQTIIEPFSPKHNVIVGRNGTGKSNFFAAIRFVLSDAYNDLKKEERASLLHEGSGSAVVTAYVEMVFDNSDDRFLTGKDELILRRTIGNKKDEYSIDRKNATKTDVVNLLESAGFSRSNPYYIVPQGRVTALTNMKDAERLNILKEVAGTQVYEARRTESIKIMDETDAKRVQIDESLAYIRDRLEELEEEKEELKEYQTHDKERRCLEYTIYHREQEEIVNALEKLEEQRATGVDETDENRRQFVSGEESLARIDEEIRALNQQMELLRVDKKQYEEERTDASKAKAGFELDVNSISEGQVAARDARAQDEKELKDVQSAIVDREATLTQITPSYNSAREQESAVKARMTDAEGTRQRLYAKQGRSAKFKTKQERDNWLKKEVEDVNVALATRKAVTMQTTEEIAELQDDIRKGDAEITSTRDQLNNHGAIMDSLDAEVQKAKDLRDRMSDQRKELWREDAKLDSVMKNAQDELNKAEQFLSHMMDRDTSSGLKTVRRIKQQQKLDGVYGTVAELLQVGERFKTAVEVTAGNSLFHYVVDNEETASTLVEILQKERAGRVTFMPLNKLRPQPGNFPSANDAVPIMSKITYDPKYEKALQQVFGRTIICPDLQVAAHYARTHNVSAITPEGDRSDKKGALSGGWVDPRKSRLDAVHALAKARDEVESHRSRKQDLRKEIEAKAQEVTQAVGELQKAEQKRQQAEKSYGPMQQQLRNKTTEIQKKRDGVEAKQRSKEHLDAAVHDLAEQQSSYEIELASDFKKALSREEEQQLEQLSASIPELRRQFADLSSKRSDLEGQKAMIEVELRENLRPRLDQLNNQEHEGGSAGTTSKLKEREQDLKRSNKALESIEKKLRETDAALDEANESMMELNQTRANEQAGQETLAKAIERSKKVSDKSAAKKALLNAKAIEANHNIRNLGVLPEEAFSNKYTAVPSDKAIKRLHKVNESLKKYSHVNKKAFEQYNNFTRNREDLIDRRAELDKSQKSIRDLIDILDQRKDEAIQRTFKQVSFEYARIFERLVPAGRGRLVIQRRSDRQRKGEEEDASDDENRQGVENYTGVGIEVSFNSKHDEQQRIQQLSGGQKSLCALALVFAIQRCDPAPFYLFDEIDANLDAQYRTAVAALLQEISESGQFICTTFRPEMVMVAEKCYGVAFSNKTSSIDVVGREHAMEFIEGQISGA